MKKVFLILILFGTINLLNSQIKDYVQFEATINNRNSDTLKIIDDHNDKVVKKILVDKYGVFKAEFSVDEGYFNLDDGKEHTFLYLKNGFDLELTMDAKMFDESIVWKGKGSDENNFLAQEFLYNESHYNENKLLFLSEDDAKKVINEQLNNSLQKIEKLDLNKNFIELEKKGYKSNFDFLTKYYNDYRKNKKLNNIISPSFDYINFNGGKTKLEDLKGKFVYIDVWATWCGPCRGEIPYLQKVEQKYHDKNIAFVSISIDEEKDFEKWRKLVADKQLGGIQLIADKNWNSDFVTTFGINAIPRFILIDPKGIVIDANAARPSEPNLQEQLDKLLKK